MVTRYSFSIKWRVKGSVVVLMLRKCESVTAKDVKKVLSKILKQKNFIEFYSTPKE